MKRIIKSVFDIRPGEWAITMLMLANYYIILVTYYFLKPARDSLFLVKVSSEQLPLVFIITALVAAPVTAFYGKASRSMRLDKLIYSTLAIMAINLLVLRWLVQINDAWVYYVFYTWVSIYGALTTSQFWLLANALYDASQAKRVFSILAVAGIVGAFTGGEVTGLAIAKLGVQTEDLLLFCVGFLAISGLLVWFVWRLSKGEIGSASPRRQENEAAENMFRTVRSIMKSRHLRLTVGIIAMTMMVASFVDYQFKTVTYQAITDKAELTAFLGQFYGRLSLVSLAVQLVLGYRIIRWLGVGGVILVLPVALLGASSFMFVMPGLIAGIVLRGSDGALKYSLDKTGRELLFMPVPLDLKKRTKTFIDMFVDRWFRGIAGGMLLLCTLVFGLTVQQISVVVIVLVVLWIILALRMRKEYVNSFRSALERREIDLEEIRTHINDASTVDSLIVSLASSNDRQVEYALDMLKSAKGVELTYPVLPLLEHQSASVRRRALEALYIHGNEAALVEVKKRLADEDIVVRCEAMKILCDRAVEDAPTALGRYLNDPDGATRSAALACVAESDDPKARALVDDEMISSLLEDKGDKGEVGRQQLARILGHHDFNRKSSDYLERLLHDPSPAVVREAMASVGAIGDRRQVGWLIMKLGERDYRRDARRGLAAYGATVLGTLTDHLIDRRVPFLVRSNIPRVLRDIPVQDTIRVLTASLERVEPRLRYHVIKALNSLRSRHQSLKFNVAEIRPALVQQARSYYEIHQILHHQRDHEETSASKLLQRALEERLDQNLEQIFRFLGLVYPPTDIYNAYHGIVSGKKDLRANAVEFMDSLLPSDVKKYVLPLLDGDSFETILRTGREMFQLPRTNREQSLLTLLCGKDNWLRTCALLVAAEQPSPAILEQVKRGLNDDDIRVRETAHLVRGRLDG